MQRIAIRLGWAAIVGGLIAGPPFLRQAGSPGPGQAMAEDTNTVMPPEVKGFRGTVTGVVAKPPGRNWFVMKVVKVAGFTPGNRVKLSADALTAVWKDKYVAVLLVNKMPPLNVGDTVSVTAFQFEMHLRSIDGNAVKLNAAGAPASRPEPTPGAKPGPRLPEGVLVTRDVQYAKVGDKSLRLDVYSPANVSGELPLVVWVHGGAWLAGTKDWCEWLYLARRGYVVASVDYRLSTEAVFPAQIEDCKAAIRFLRANAKRFSIDPNRIGVGGDSAGGHLAALLGTSGDVKELEGAVGDNLSTSSRVQCVVDFYGPSDMFKFKGQPVGPKVDDPKSPLCKLFGGMLADKADLVARANPISYVTKDDPPFLVLHGNADHTVPFNQSELLVDALRKAGVDVTFEVDRGGGHGFAAFQNGKYQPIVAAFLDKHLKQAAASRPAEEQRDGQ